jgi:hypothetical protein
LVFPARSDRPDDLCQDSTAVFEKKKRKKVYLLLQTDGCSAPISLQKGVKGVLPAALPNQPTCFAPMLSPRQANPPAALPTLPPRQTNPNQQTNQPTPVSLSLKYCILSFFV